VSARSATAKNRCRRAREIAGLSEAQAAGLLGVEQIDLAAIEFYDLAFWDADRGKAPHAKIADLYHVDVDWMRGESELRDYAAIDRVPGARDGLSFHDRDLIAEFTASLPRRPR
jgi:hypothetical protein